MSGTVRLPSEQVRWLLRGALAAASKDDVTPILCAVRWTIADGRVTVISTDRYRVHQLYVPAPSGTPDGEFVMSRYQAELLVRWGHGSARQRAGEVIDLTCVDAELGKPGIGEKFTRRHRGSIQFDILEFDGPDADRITHVSDQVAGNYPPVARLFDDATAGAGEGEALAGSLALNPDLLSATRHLRVDRGEPLRFLMPKLTERDTKESGGSARRPMLVENIHGTARALVQPNIALHGWKRYGS